MLREYELGMEAAGYIRQQLGVGHGLARLTDLPLESGRIVTYLPPDITASQLLGLDSGGVANGEEGPRLTEFVLYSSFEEALTVVKETHGYPTVGVLTSLSPDRPGLTHRQQAASDILGTFARRTEQLIIGAFDGEAWIIWKRPGRLSAPPP
jgi:hypothetical protein